MKMTPETELSPPEDEISQLGLLLVVAGNARLRIFGPILAGLIAPVRMALESADSDHIFELARWNAQC